MKRHLFTAISVTALLASGTVFAREAFVAQVTDIQGQVLVDSGSGFVRIGGPGGLKLGDKVLVKGKGSHAVLDYGKGCSFPVPVNTVATIAEATCTTGTQGGPVIFERFRPLSWGILSGIATLVMALIYAAFRSLDHGRLGTG